MVPIRIIETERDDFEGPIVELWRDDDFIGMVFWDGESTIAQVYPDGAGDPHDLDVAEFQQLLDTALKIVDPHAFDEDLTDLREAVAEAVEESDDLHPATAALLGEFDDQAVYRNEDGEGFFRKEVAEEFIAKCEELDLAVIEMEGFDLVGVTLMPRPQLDLAITGKTAMSWLEFRTYANTTVAEKLRIWPSRATLVIAFVIQQPDNESIVA